MSRSAAGYARIAAAALLLMACASFGAMKGQALVHWMDYSTALEKAKKNPRLIFVDLYADWCIPCRVMDASVYSDPSVAAFLVLPAFVLVAPKGLTILTVSDSMSPQEMQSLLSQFLVKEEEWIKR